jgi:hypothetical protein
METEETRDDTHVEQHGDGDVKITVEADPEQQESPPENETPGDVQQGEAAESQD